MCAVISNIIQDQIFDEERALYNLKSTTVIKCDFAGPKDGESALKEARNINVDKCRFDLRYPLWHVDGFTVSNSEMTENCRAALWYSRNGKIVDSSLEGIKALRECENVHIRNCSVKSGEFGWKCNNISIENSAVEAEYLFLDTKDITFKNTRMKGKYSFQYTENVTVKDCSLDTKDAFWHAKNVTVENCIVKGEYLAWFSENVVFKNCRIIGTQPLCYCKGLELINCSMEDTDLAFEYSDVEADVYGHVISIKNPKSGTITVDSIGEVIMENAVMDCSGVVKVRQ